MEKALRIVKGILFVTLLFGPVVLPAVSFAQGDDKSVKQDMKDAGHSTKEAAKKTGKKIKKGTKKVVHKSAEKTAEGAEKVEEKTKP